MYEEQNQNVRNSIAVYKTDRKLVELRDKLNPSFWGNYAELHGHADVDGNGKVYSNIGVVLYDYSNGTGNNTVKVYVNVTPEDIYWLYNALTSHTENFELEQTKIFGQPDNNGYSQMTKLRIARAGVAAAATVVLMIPPMVIFLLCQSSVVETMAQSGLKD